MQFQVHSPDGEVLYTQAQLEHALAQRSARRVLPAWMQSLVWPAGMVHAMRNARRCNARSTLRAILVEARMLFDAEHAGLTTAAAAIRYRLREKYEDLYTARTCDRRQRLTPDLGRPSVDCPMTDHAMRLDTHGVGGVNSSIRSPRTGQQGPT